MAYQPGYSGLLNSAFPRIGQYEAATGRRINKQVVQGLLQADLDRSKQMAMQMSVLEKNRQQQMDMEQQRIDIAKEQQKDSQMAGMVGGAGQLLQLPIAYGAAKSMGWFGKSAPAVATPAGTAQAAVAPSVAALPAQTSLLQAPGALSMPATQAPILNTATTFGDTAAGLGATGTGAAPASPGLLGTTAGGLGAAAGLYAAQYATGKAVQPWADKHGLGTTAKGWTYAGLPGASVGLTVDVGKKVWSEAKDFVSKVF